VNQHHRDLEVLDTDKDEDIGKELGDEVLGVGLDTFNGNILKVMAMVQSSKKAESCLSV
jgi:hypothetical protein